MHTIIPEPARLAILRGVRRGDTVAYLEYLGLSPRVIDRLEESQYGIMLLEQLVRLREDELLEIHSFGEMALNQVMSCLSRYNELEQHREELEEPLQCRIAVARKKRMEGARARRRRRRPAEQPVAEKTAPAAEDQRSPAQGTAQAEDSHSAPPEMATS